MGEVTEAEGGAAEVLEAAVNGLCRDVAGAKAVEVGERVLGSAFQGAAEGNDFGQRGWDACEVSDHGGKLSLRGEAVGIAVGLDDPLVDAPGRVDRGVFIGGEQAVQSIALPVGEEARAGAEGPADPVERSPERPR